MGDETGAAVSVLVVDDDPMVAEIARRILSAEGYRVIVAGGADEALARAESSGWAIDLLLTDIEMPGLSGPDLAESLKERVPGLRVLFMSGQHGPPAGAPFLGKPFNSAAMNDAVREVLDG